MQKLICIALLLLFTVGSIWGQNDKVEVQGFLKIDEPETVSGHEYILTRLSNNKIATAPAHSIQPEHPKPLPLASGWVNNGGGYQEGMYYLFEDKVYLDGTIKKAAGNIGLGDTLFILPDYYRPDGTIILHAKFEAERVRLNVGTDGVVRTISGPSTINWLSLDGLWFYKPPPQIGDLFGGGIIFYIANPPADLNGDGVLDRGLVAAEADLADSPWGCSGTAIAGAYGLAIGDGFANTTAIVQQCNEATFAAKLCYEATINGYDDWFLPSLEELQEMNLAIGRLATGSLENLGNFDLAWYNSSSQSPSDNTYPVYSSNNVFQNSSKTTSRGVRPIRVF